VTSGPNEKDEIYSYWELNQELGTILQFDYEAFYAHLLNAGLKSLGMLTLIIVRFEQKNINKIILTLLKHILLKQIDINNIRY